MGYLKKIGDKKFRIMYDVPWMNGKRRQKTETLVRTTKRHAEAILAEREAAVVRGECATSGDVRMNELFDRFMQVKAERLAPATLHRYDGLLGVYLRPAFGTRKAGSIRATDLVSAYSQWARRPISGRTVRHAADLMRNVLNRAVKWGILPRNPATLLDNDDLPKVVKPESTVLTEAELRQLLAEAQRPALRSQARGYLCAHSAFYPALAFAAFTGARQGEVLAVRWRDVDFAEGSVTISRSLTDSPRARLTFKLPKNDKPRTICISSQLVRILQSHRVVQEAEKIAFGTAYRDQDLVFTKPDGSPIAPWSFSSAFRDFVKRSAVRRIRFHDLRDTHASLLAKAGVPIEVIGKRLGHSSIGVTVDRYVTVYRDRDAAAAEAFEQLMT